MKDESNFWAIVSILIVAAVFVVACLHELQSVRKGGMRPEKIIDRTHVQTRDGNIYTVLESHEP